MTADPLLVALRVQDLFCRLPRHDHQTPRAALPPDGIYVWFERGETFGGGTGLTGDRIVRVGTHRAAGRLPARIRQHYGPISALGGDRGASIFRFHLGTALLRRDDAHDPRLAAWLAADGPPQPEVEAAVSRVLRESFTFACVRVDDPEERLRQEAALIALLAQHPVAPPSPSWLGRSAARAAIPRSGLWNTQHVAGAPLTAAQLERLEALAAGGDREGAAADSGTGVSRPPLRRVAEPRSDRDGRVATYVTRQAAINWSVVRPEHVLAAIRRYDAGERPRRQAQNTWLLHEGDRYPAKFIRLLAFQEATGRPLDPSADFSGGAETARFLRNLGFTVEYPVGNVAAPEGPPVDRSQEVVVREPDAEAWPGRTAGPVVQVGAHSGPPATRPLRVALVVRHDDFAPQSEDEHQFSKLRAACRRGEIDLVVYPEGYRNAPRGKVQPCVDRLAEQVGAPVLAGIHTEDGFEVAAYRNPKPAPNETVAHHYVKHSTAGRLAFEWPGYETVRDGWFRPIRLRGHAVGVQVCHDMFFGLIGQKLRHAGATMLVDLSGYNVNDSKWTNVILGRSIDLDLPFLCTLSYHPDAFGIARTFAYDRGRPLPTTSSTFNEGETGWFEVYEIQPSTPADTPAPTVAAPKATSREYDAITLSLGSSAAADVRVSLHPEGLRVSGKGEVPAVGAWRAFDARAGRLGVLPLPLEALWDGLAIFRSDAPRGTFRHHLVVYAADAAPEDLGAVWALMKLRAIEHRVATVLLAGDAREVIKPTMYRNVQRIPERNGRFGMDARHLGGTWTGAASGMTSEFRAGIPEPYFSRYLELMDDLR